MKDIVCGTLKNGGNSDRQVYNGIDLAKLICSVLVVAIHVAPFGEPQRAGIAGGGWRDLLNFGIQNCLARLAVPFFFVSSGYFLYKKNSLDHFSIDPVRKYVIRMARLYIAWNILYVPMAFTGFLDNENGMAYAAAAYIRNILLTGYAHLWYINATIFSVILITFLLSKKIKPKRILFLGFAFFVLGLLADSWFGVIVPLKGMFPKLWKCLHLVKFVIGSTRNGLFGGFLFVGIGMCFAFFDIKIERKKALLGFVLSLSLLFLEVSVLEGIGFIREYGMYLCLVPATFFGFSLALDIKLPACKKGETMRTVSALIYFTHMQIAVFVRNILLGISEPLEASALKFILTLAVTVVFALLVIKISEKPRFAWLKKLYG